MKPIGIGRITKAKLKSLSRHEHELSEPLMRPATFTPSISQSETPTTATKPHASQAQTPDEEEGQLSVDVYQTPTEMILIAPVAGTPPGDININITDDVITIKGFREIPNKESVPTHDPYMKECFWGKFSRAVILPGSVDASKAEARFKNNILTIRIPKTERVRTRLIQIREE